MGQIGDGANRRWGKSATGRNGETEKRSWGEHGKFPLPYGLLTGHEQGLGETGKGMARKDYVVPPPRPPTSQRERDAVPTEQRIMG